LTRRLLPVLLAVLVGWTVGFVSPPARGPVGNLATYSDTGGTASFTYDDLDRLTAADYPGGSDFAYSYDTVGNVTAITTPAGTLAFSYDLADRITSAGPGPAPAAPAYDANGNLTSDGSYGGRTYAYDPLGRLVGVSGGGHSASYTLDGAGNRLAQTVDTVTTGFDLDLSIPDSTVLSDGTRTYLPGDPGAGSLSGGVWTSMLTDQLGTGLLTVTGGGSVGTPRQVGPYGLDRDGSVLAPGIGYTGEWSDATGLVNLRARAYDPLLARFLGRDTFGGVASAPQTANRYSYAANNPFRYTDPSGRFIQAALDHPGELASLAVSLTVVPGLALAAWAAVTGSDPFTGRLLSGEEAAAGLLFAGLGPFGKLLGAARGAATAALGRFDDIFGRFVHAMRDLPGRGLETLRGLRTRGLGWLGDLGAGLRARFGAIGRGGGAVDGPGDKLPHGFDDAEQFRSFGTVLDQGLKKAGYGDAKAAIQGSAATGVSFRTGERFDVGRLSDFDVAIASPTAMARARELGIAMRSGGTRTGPLIRTQPELLGLREVIDEMSSQVGRPVRFMLYESLDAAIARAPSIVVPLP
jgi:RHS repeat-associated protein